MFSCRKKQHLSRNLSRKQSQQQSKRSVRVLEKNFVSLNVMAAPGGTPGGGGTPTQLPPPYPGFSPSHSPSPHAGAAGQGAGVPSPSPQFYPPAKPAPSPSMMMPSPSSAPSHVGHSVHGGAAAAPMGYSEADEKQKLRFQVELEFVQCLGNPNYLNFLAQRGYFKDPAFVNYLSYLRYWSKPEYVKFIKFPVCLHFLELLQHEAFRKEIANGAVSLVKQCLVRSITYSFLSFSAPSS